MDDQNKNLILAMVLSSLVLVVWMILFAPDPAELEAQRQQEAATAAETQGDAPTVSSADTGAAPATAPTEAAEPAPEAERVAIDTPSLVGSISMAGGRIDELSLKQYHVSLAADSEEVTLLSPAGSEDPYYALFGWLPGGSLEQSDVPTPETIWFLEKGTSLAVGSPVTLRWDSPAGLIFRREIGVDDRFMFTITQSVENPTGEAARLAPYGVVARQGEPKDLSGFFIIHEGAIGRHDGQLYDTDYADIPDFAPNEDWGNGRAEVTKVEQGGWIGFTDHYWMTTLIPDQGKPFTSVVEYVPASDTYRTFARMPTIDVAAGASSATTTRLFAGAKEWETIRDYEAGRRIEGFGPAISYFLGFGGDAEIEGFINAIDWGWFYYLTKADFLRPARVEPAYRQHRLGDHRPDAADQGAFVPACAQILCLDGADEGTSARDGEAEGTLR